MISEIEGVTTPQLAGHDNMPRLISGSLTDLPQRSLSNTITLVLQGTSLHSQPLQTYHQNQPETIPLVKCMAFSSIEKYQRNFSFCSQMTWVFGMWWVVRRPTTRHMPKSHITWLVILKLKFWSYTPLFLAQKTVHATNW